MKILTKVSYNYPIYWQQSNLLYFPNSNVRVVSLSISVSKFYGRCPAGRGRHNVKISVCLCVCVSVYLCMSVVTSIFV